MSKQKFTGSMKGKGYYIALILCAAAIGISGYMFYRNANQPEPEPQSAAVTDPALDPDIQAVATNPVPGSDPDTTDSTQPGGTEPSVEITQPPKKRFRPVDGQVISQYAADVLSYNQTTRDWRTHNGIDIAATAGTDVAAAMDGTVYTVYEDDALGTTVVLRHSGGYMTTYASLDPQTLVKPGDTVTAGQTIGKVGVSALLETAIGDHVHFSVTCDGVSVDPEEFLS